MLYYNDMIETVKNKYRRLNPPGEKRECAGRDYVIGKTGQWCRKDMTVQQKRDLFHANKKSK